MIKRLNCTGKRYYIFMVLTIAVAIFYVALMCNKTMPFAEGWYTYYAQLINEKGLLPYKDFEYLFSPLYIYFIAFVTRFFGYDILTLRCVGILMFAIIALGVYLFITEIVGRKNGVDCCNYFRYSGYVSTVRSSSDFFMTTSDLWIFLLFLPFYS